MFVCRFGTDSGLNGSDEMKKSEKDKRKARADRFTLISVNLPCNKLHVIVLIKMFAQ